MEFKIETNVTKPKVHRNRGGRVPTYPFATMKVGDTFKQVYETADKGERDKVNRKIRTAILTFNQSHKNDPRVFTTLSLEGNEVDENGNPVEKDGKPGLRVYCEARKEKPAATVQAAN